MNADVFIEELRERFLPFGKLNVATINVPRELTTLYDAVWLVQKTHSGIEVHIHDLQKAQPEVTIDVQSHRSLNYPIGITTSDVMKKAAEEYGNLPQEMNYIEQYANIIYGAFNVSIAYEKAESLFYQYRMGKGSPSLLQLAYGRLNDFTFNNTKCHQLLNEIKMTAHSQNITLV